MCKNNTCADKERKSNGIISKQTAIIFRTDDLNKRYIKLIVK